MINGFKGLFKSKAAVIISISAVVLLAAIVIAALTGVFGNLGRAEEPTTPASTDMQQDVAIDPNALSGLMESVVDISANESDSLGVSTTSAFRLLFSKAADEQALAASLIVEPAQAFSIKKLSDKEFSMKFDKPLKSDSIYNVSLNDKNTGEKKSWAFQTKRQFRVIRTMPRDKSVGIPLNSGIEITFSNDGLENADRYFEISPKVNGRFEWNKKTLVFVPENDLDADTIYTVTIKKGLRVAGSKDELQNDYSFRFQTVSENADESGIYFSFSDNMYNFTPQTVPALEVYTQESLINQELPVEIYSYPDTESFMNDLKKAESGPSWATDNRKDIYDLTRLAKISSFQGQIIQHKTSSYWSNNYLLFPSQLAEGYYLAVTEIDGEKYFVQLQVNTASVYIMTTKDKSLLWLNDTLSGKPISGASFTLDQGASSETDSNGLAELDNTPVQSDTSANYFTIKPKTGLPFVACVRYDTYYSMYNNYDSSFVDNYWSYIYLDRSVYLTSDTINVWGILKPRNTAVTETEAELELISYNYYSSNDDSTSVLTSQSVTISPDGTYAGSLKINNYNPGSYEVRLKVGGKVMLTRYLQIMDYTKPVYRIDVKPDKNCMYAWDTVNFDITSSFFEGTPASGIYLDYTQSISYINPVNGTLVCDSNGKAKLSVKGTTPDAGWRPVSLSFDVSNSDAQEQQTSEYTNISVFPKDTMIETETKTENGIGNITFTTSRIDISKLKDLDKSYYLEDDYRGEKVNIPLSVKLYEKHYEKKKTGDYYDYINKVRRDTYEYYEVQNLVKEYIFNTENGKYTLQYESDSDKQYVAEIFANDSKGRPISDSIYVYNWDSFDPYYKDAYTITTDWQRQYKTGEQITAEVRYNKEEPYTGDSRKYLFVRMRSGILDCNVSENAVYNFSFDKEFIPNLYVKALCFDGNGIYDAGIAMYKFDMSEKKLDIDIKSDKESYKPGDEVKLTVLVKDGSGKPVASEVNISLVDEAFFALYPQYTDTLSSLYEQSVSSGLLSEYLSFKAMDEFGSPMAEMGGEGGNESVRKDFKDTALFTTVNTGTDGKTEVTFKMPDNLTSWRVTTQAVTKDVCAGSNTINISSKLPFFVDSIFNKRFLTGDTPSIMVSANGNELKAGDEVSFKVTITDINGRSRGSYITKGASNLYHELQLDELAQGTYTVRIEGSCGSLSDAMERSFTVSDSMLETTVTDYTKLSESTSVTNGTKGLTTLVFYNEDSSVLYNELHQLYWSWGQRLDQVLSRKISGKLLQNYFNESMYSFDEPDLSEYQMGDGGLALLPYDSSSPELSAKMCSLAADSIDRGALAFYFRSLIESEETAPEDVIYAYWGLAALKEPVLLDIRSMLKEEGLDLKSKLVLGAALAEAGDHQGAAEVYKAAMKDSVKATDTFAWIENGSRDDSIDATAISTLIAMKINAPEKIKLLNYIESNSTSKLLVNLERMIFVTNYIKDASLVSSFTYELDGEKKQVELQKGSSFSMILTPERLAAVKFSGITGNIQVASSYTTPISEQMKNNSDLLSIDRAYDTGSRKGPVRAFNRSEIVRVTLTVDFEENAPDGYYEVTDILPAGLRYIQPVYGQEGTENNWNYANEVTGQKAVFGYYYNKNYPLTDNDKTIQYYAKVVSPGIYTADSAAIRHTDKDIASFSKKVKVTINK